MYKSCYLQLDILTSYEINYEKYVPNKRFQEFHDGVALKFS